jgi:UDP-N-acetylmuramate--alanine ligase
VLLLADIYPAGEEAIPGVTAEELVKAIGTRGHRHAFHAGDLRSACDRLCTEAREGDVVLTLGAGSVWTAGEELLRRRGA